MSNPLNPNGFDSQFNGINDGRYDSEINDGRPGFDNPNKKRKKQFGQTESPPYTITDAMSVVMNPCLRQRGVTPPIIWTDPD